MEFGLSPPSTDIFTEPGEVECRNVKIMSTLDNLEIEVEDKWSKGGLENDPSKLVMNAEDFEISMSYEKHFTISKMKEVQFCVVAKNAGVYKGAVIFEAQNGNLAVGSWINLYAGEIESQKSAEITGFASKEEIVSEKPLKINGIYYVLGLMVVLLFCLSFMFWKLKAGKRPKMRKKRRK